MATDFDLAQTFYIDADAVQTADTIYITSVDLYFQQKPTEGKTNSGINKPGVTLYLCPVNNDVPQIAQYISDSRARVEFDSVATSNTAATATKFTFEYPVAVKTARSYAFLVKFDGSDDGYKLWWNKGGEKILNTNQNTQVSSGKVDGFFYSITNGKVLTALRDADLKFKVRVAKFTSSAATLKFVNKEYEFLKFYANSISGNFFGGEYVYQNTSPSTGTLTISTDSLAVVGSGTSFSSTFQVGDKFVISDGTDGNTEVRAITGISNNTYLTIDVYPSFSNTSGSFYKTAVGKVFDFNSSAEYLTLEQSTANSSVKFVVDQFVKGVDSQAIMKIQSIDNFEANYLRPMFNIYTPSGTYADVNVNFANSTYQTATGNKVKAEVDKELFLDNYLGIVASRTNEVDNSAGLFTGAKSFQGEVEFTTTNDYTSPLIKEENLDLFTYRYNINNSVAAENTPYGNALSKYVSKKIVLAEGQDAEDIRVYLTAYKPANTDIKVYVKFHNVEDPEPFDDKNWSELELLTDRTLLSNPANKSDFIELEYKIPLYRTGTEASGFFTTQSGNNIIVGTSGSVNTDISTSDVVRLYSPDAPSNYLHSVVTAANTTSITLADDVVDTNLVGDGFKVVVVDDKNSAFINSQNANVVRYYNGALSAFDGYKTFTTKIVLLSDNNYRVPFVDNIRSVAISA